MATTNTFKKEKGSNGTICNNNDTGMNTISNGSSTDNSNPNPNPSHPNNDEHDYANKHVPQVLHRTYQDTKDIIQMIHDGSQLNIQNFIDPNHSLSIHKPIMVTDTAASIGMKVPKGKSKIKKKVMLSSPASSMKVSTLSNILVQETMNPDVITSISTSSTDNNIDNNNNSTTHEYHHPPITIREIGQIIGMNHPVSVMDVKTQDEMEGWCMTDLVEYFEDEDRLYQQNKDISHPNNNHSNPSLTSPRRKLKKSSKPRVLNQISLEFSNTTLRKHTLSPSFVRDIDWIDNIWPRNRRYDSDGNDTYPRVQYYCLTSTAGCYTDFHIDFGGTSVWYHVLSGRKVFLLIPPTAVNIKLYESWLCSKNQGDIFFPDMTLEEIEHTSNNEQPPQPPHLGNKKMNKVKQENVDDSNQSDENVIKKILQVESCVRVTLEQNQTFVIPTGWIHAVYTPVDSIVIGGNFLHGFDIKGQLDIHCLETRTRVPAKFRFPYFVQLMAYAGKEYFKRIVDPHGVVFEEELDGIEVLIQALRSWAVTPGGDADRPGSVAYVMRDCVNELQSNDITSFDMMLDVLDSEVKRIKKDGIEKYSFTDISHCSSPSNKLKLTLKRKSPLKDPETIDEKNTIDVSNFPHIVDENKIATKSKRSKIGDLASKQTLDDEEWLPDGRNEKSKNRNRPLAKGAKRQTDSPSIKCRKNIPTKIERSGKSNEIKRSCHDTTTSVRSRLKKKLGAFLK